MMTTKQTSIPFLYKLASHRSESYLLVLRYLHSYMLSQVA
jgi:hypothetical protein